MSQSRLLALALLGTATGCMVLNTMAMSKDCQDQYNTCLDGCPKPPPNLTNDPQGMADTTTPACVDACNRAEQSCK